MPFPEQEQWGGGGLCLQGCAGRKGPATPPHMLNPSEPPCPCPAGEASEAWGERRSSGLAGAWPGREAVWRVQTPGHCMQSWTPQPGLQGDGVPCWGLDSRDPRPARGAMTQPRVWLACAPPPDGRHVDSEAPSSAPTPSPDFPACEGVGVAALPMPLRSSSLPSEGSFSPSAGRPEHHITWLVGPTHRVAQVGDPRGQQRWQEEAQRSCQTCISIQAGRTEELGETSGERRGQERGTHSGHHHDCPGTSSSQIGRQSESPAQRLTLPLGKWCGSRWPRV